MKPTLLAFVAAFACLAGAALYVLEHDTGGGAVTPHEVSARASLSSRSVLFGDSVEARLDLILPRTYAGIALNGKPNFKPFRVVSTQTDRSELGGGLEQISVRYNLMCLSPRCVTTGQGTEFAFAPTVIRIPDGPHLKASWPPLVEVSRAQDVKAPVTDDLPSVPAVFPGLQPHTYADEALIAAAVSLVALVAAWYYVRVRVRRRIEAAARAATLLQTLLARVEAGVPEEVIYQQRHALDALAVELRNRHINGTLALRAERLAWAPEYPDPREIRQLCSEIRLVANA